MIENGGLSGSFASENRERRDEINMKGDNSVTCEARARMGLERFRFYFILLLYLPCFFLNLLNT